MAHSRLAAGHLRLIQTKTPAATDQVSGPSLNDLLGIVSTSTSGWIRNLPFGPDDATAGSETELQAAVIGERGAVDLPLVIENANYYK